MAHSASQTSERTAGDENTGNFIGLVGVAGAESHEVVLPSAFCPVLDEAVSAPNEEHMALESRFNRGRYP